MRRCISFAAAIAVAATAPACGGRAHDAVSATPLTSATISVDDRAPVAEQIARTICIHEVECGRVRDPEMCVEAAKERVGDELAAWTCDPEGTRIGAEQCLATLREATCAVDLSARARVCPYNGGCATVTSDPAASR